MNGFRFNFRNSLQMKQETKRQILVDNSQQEVIPNIPHSRISGTGKNIIIAI